MRGKERKMRKSNKKQQLSHADITKALQKFKHDGGLIKKLPDQVVPKGVLVGGQFAVYESVFGERSGQGGSSTVEAAQE
jgi:hypothetical protein